MAVFGVMYFKGKNNGQVAGEQNAANNEQNNQAEQKVEMQITAADWFIGNKDAKVKIFSFSDFQCPYCARFHNYLHDLVKAYPNDVVWVFRNFPIQSHPMGLPGALAAECAGAQGKFFEMADKIFAGQSGLGEEKFNTFATELGLNLTEFKACVAEQKPKDKISADYELGVQSGIQGTPTSFINGEKVEGAVPLESLKKLVDGLLK